MKKTCKNCGKVGLPKGKRKYCSHSCYKQWNAKQQAKKRGTNELRSITNCLSCDKDISGEKNRYARKYCKSCQILDGNARYSDNKEPKQYADYLAESRRRQRERPTYWINVNES